MHISQVIARVLWQCKGLYMLKGIDISNWQAGEKPSDYPIDFCICKATEGLNFVDYYCDSFIQNCIENDILFGYYHFAQSNDPKKEAKFFWNNTLGYCGHGIPVLDYEVWGHNSDVEWCENFLEEYHEISGVWAVLYISASRCGQFENSWIPEKCGLWVAGYPMDYTEFISENTNMPYNIYPWSFAAIWQFTSNLWYKFDGDVAYMDYVAWKKYAGDKTQNTNPKPIEKSIDDLALEVILGEYGTGKQRKKLLGKRYNEVQKRINQLYKIANEVIKGKWGVNEDRKNRLEKAGYPYSTIQHIVNDILS